VRRALLRARALARHYREQVDAGECGVDGCAEPAEPNGARDCCSLHYKRLRSRGAIGMAERGVRRISRRCRGKPWLDAPGHRRVKVDDAIRASTTS
jgi:hypothetical protein